MTMGALKFPPPGRQQTPPRINTYVRLGPFAFAFLYTSDGTTTMIGVDTSGAGTGVGITIPDPSTVVEGRRMMVKDEGNNASVHSISVDAAAGTLEGGSYLINTNGGFVEFYSDGISKWFLCDDDAAIAGTTTLGPTNANQTAGYAGLATLSSGSVVVTTNKVTSNSLIFLSQNTVSGVSVATAVAVSARTPGTSFTITSANVLDSSKIAWVLMEPV